MLSINFIVCAFFGLLQLSAGATDYKPCVTPKNESSLCIKLTECSSLDTLAQKFFATNEERIFLAQSQCDYKDKTVFVCCPPDRTVLANSLLPKDSECGISPTSQISTGNHTVPGEFPWMALIEYTKPGNKKGFHCGGALINNRYIITAAHCLMAKPEKWEVTKVRLGDWKLDSNIDCISRERCAAPSMDVGIEDQISHLQYNPRLRNQENDIALLRLSKTITMSDYIKPICLPFDEGLRAASLADYDEMIVAGWGNAIDNNFTSEMLKTTAKVTNFSQCKREYTSQRVTLQATQMCVAGEAGVATCYADSGGPVIKQLIRNKGYYLIGVKSFGPSPCTLENWPDVYTRVSEYKYWIETTIRP